MGCVLLFLEQLLKRLLCREGRAVLSHVQCLLPNFKMGTFAFVPKLRKLVWDLKNFRFPMSSVALPWCLTRRLNCSGCSYWDGDNDTWFWTLTSSLFSLYPLKACKQWKGKIRFQKCDFVVTANPRYLLLAVVWGITLSFFIPSVFLPYSCQKPYLPFWHDRRSALQSHVAPFLV